MHAICDKRNYILQRTLNRDKWVALTTAWRVLRLRMKEQSPVRRVAANVLNKQSLTADKGGPPAWGLGEVLTTPHRKYATCYEMFTTKTRVNAVKDP